MTSTLYYVLHKSLTASFAVNSLYNSLILRVLNQFDRSLLRRNWVSGAQSLFYLDRSGITIFNEVPRAWEVRDSVLHHLMES